MKKAIQAAVEQLRLHYDAKNYRNLLLTMACGVGGSVVCVWGAVQEEKEKLSMRKLGQ